MSGWGGRAAGLMAILTLTAAMGASGAQGLRPAPELRARLGGARFEMQVLGIDADGIRMRPIGSTDGEVVVPLRETRDLHFILPEAFRLAQQAAFNGRPGEALRWLQPVIPPLLPYVRAPGTNAVPAVTTYYDLLLGQQQWDEALALARALPLDVPGTDFLSKTVQLARVLRATGRALDAATLINRIPINAETMASFGLLADFAHELRRNGHFTEAQLIYERLQPFDTGAAAGERALLIAYTVYHQGAPLRAAALLEAVSEPTGEAGVRPLYLLLRGRLALDAQKPDQALDALSRGLVFAPGTSEWRAELLAVTAAAYRAAGESEIAAAIEQDLRRIYAGSRWTPAGPPET